MFQYILCKFVALNQFTGIDGPAFILCKELYSLTCKQFQGCSYEQLCTSYLLLFPDYLFCSAGISEIVKLTQNGMVY